MMPTDSASQAQFIAPLEALPEVVLDMILHPLAKQDRTALIHLARTSPRVFAPAVTVAVRTASACWVDLHAHHNFQIEVGCLVYATKSDGSAPDVSLVTAKALCDHTLAKIGPIATSQLRSLLLSPKTVDLIPLVLPYARTVFCSFSLPTKADGRVLDMLERAHGFTSTTTHLTVQLDQDDPELRSEPLVRRLAMMMAQSQIKSLHLRLGDSNHGYDAELAGGGMFSIAEMLLTVGMPPHLVALSMHGPTEPEELPIIPMLDDLPLQLMWPQSLRRIKLFFGTPWAGFPIKMLPSLSPVGNTLHPGLCDMELVNIPMDVLDMHGKVLAVLSPTLERFHLQVTPIDFEGVDLYALVHSVIEALAAVCPALRDLDLCVLAEHTMTSRQFLRFSRVTAPLLKAFRELRHFSLVGWGVDTTDEAMAAVDAVFLAAPSIRSLDLSLNESMDLDMATRIVQSHHTLCRVILACTKVKRRDVATLCKLRRGLTVLVHHEGH
ncbi:hypothetical protein AMAG_09156 [Allomyces macrogynus ATCC 38327]|uniref:F-box domain-containing protein n=1 Tax=Allomyces macrogynus (strain ATCC 38327) TaxID=578462 RepID=A0A0L0SNY2_ALLM3|nr:hypothetical protein AMAG_09156 [Allomyces macrogynus ATCC 38327]|eukprot:KNE64094.1 hypothetical protein AMAG_09156 [Allomyces macrogynus ATCC 38327]